VLDLREGKSIPPEGPKTAKVVIVGESPKKFDIIENKMFSKFEGVHLSKLLQKAGLTKYECYMTYAYKKKIKGDDSKKYLFNKTKPKDELLKAQKELIAEIESVNPNITICLGSLGMQMLHNDFSMSLTKYRGSILTSVAGKVLATYSPSQILGNRSLLPIAEVDFKKVKEEKNYPEIRRKERKLLTNPTKSEILNYLEDCNKAEYLSFDIETIQANRSYIDCIGLAYRDNLAMCIPICHIDGKPWWNKSDEIEIWIAINKVMSNPKIKKIAQNAEYDTLILRRHLVEVRNLSIDTMCNFHCLYSELPKGLDFLVSIYTDHPYYKDEIRGNRHEYNAKDACLTYEVAFKIMQDSQSINILPFYNNHVHPLIYTYIDIQDKGIKIDKEKREEARKIIQAEINDLQSKLNEKVGREINVNSSKQIQKYLYEDLKLPVRKNKKTKKPSADEDALKKLAIKYKLEELQWIRDIRKNLKMINTYINAPEDDDGRMRASFKITGTESGRLSSGSSVDGTGTSFHGIPKDSVAREFFVADEGYKLVAGDLSQAEARIVAYVAEDDNMIYVFDSGQDIHTINASNIFNIPIEEVTKEQRNRGKTFSHAGNYMMGVRTCATIAEVPEREAKILLKNYLDAYPMLSVWHSNVKKQVERSRFMENAFGRKRFFFGNAGDSLVREAISYYPQSTTADCVHRATRVIHAKLPQESRIVVNKHDELIVLCKENLVEKVSKIITEELEKPFVVKGRTKEHKVVLPVDISIGSNWREL